MEKTCDPKRFEEKWYRYWMEKDLFSGNPRLRRPAFSMVMPPPNITGELHVGHALNNTLQDILIRWKRMCRTDTIWIPGTDHAGIATQMVVERRLAENGQSRTEMGRERFVDEVWEWRERFGRRIIDQLKRLGVSCDWSREKFTLDPDLSKAVRAAFVRLHRENLIYRGEYIVNWCPGCRTAVSDLEVVHEETEGRLYTIKYQILGEDAFLPVATTRPETLLGDTAVAVHPEDKRYRKWVGREVILPVLGRKLPILADSFVDPKFGTGAVKVTPAHDPNDFHVGKRHNLPAITVMDEEGRMNQKAGPYAGQDRFRCRKEITEQLQREGLLLRVEEHHHSVGQCQRCRTPVEPRLSLQWFLRVSTLAAPAVEAVEDGRIRFFPESWKKTYFEWMRNIHDWCISRQLWWGHRIPAWHCGDCNHIVVSETLPKTCSDCGGKRLRQEEDVLDTWFSSALWPFSTLGWPQRTRDLNRYYPTAVLVTGYDIIFFWVARMIMMGLKFRGEVPFHEVYFNGLVRDARGEKMSKTRGNVIDPIDVIDQYGADAVRFTLAILAVPGTEIPLAPDRMAGYRTFVNKIWNASRFVLMKIPAGEQPALPPRARLGLAERWILSRVNQVSRQVKEALEQYRFDEAANQLYHFVWHEFCDWYVEFSKLSLPAGEDGEENPPARWVLVEVLGRLLRLLHPFMPFVTEELWQKLPPPRDSIMVSAFPEFRKREVDEKAEEKMKLLIQVITKIRNIRAETRIDPSRKVFLLMKVEGKAERRLLEEQEKAVLRLTRAAELTFTDQFETDLVAARGGLPGIEFAIPLAGILDIDAERGRLSREKEKVETDLKNTFRKLNNDGFLNNAPPEIVAKVQKEHRQLIERRTRLEENLKQLVP